MTWLYLGLSVCWAWFTYNLFRPRYVGPYKAALSFLAGWLTGELVLVHIAAQLIVTLLFAWLGAFEFWPARVGLLLSLLSWAGLAWHQRECARAETAVEDALVEGLGAGYRERIAPELRDGLDASVPLEIITRPYRIRHPEVERIRDIRFARAAGLNLKLDVYRHNSKPEGCPVLLQVHGGGWVIGRKDDQGLPLMNRMASRGWVCVSVNYRLSPHATFPDHLIDLKRAIEWIRANAAEYGADPAFIAVTGGSAGGHLSALLGLSANDPVFQPGFEEADTSVAAAVPFYGIYDFTDRDSLWRHRGLPDLLERRVLKGSLEEKRELYEAASPRSRRGEEAPPFMIVHGDRDTLAMVEDARAFASELRARSRQPVVYAEIPGAQHAFEIFPSVRTHYVLDGVDRFLSYVYSQYRASQAQAQEQEQEQEQAQAEADAGRQPQQRSESQPQPRPDEA